MRNFGGKSRDCSEHGIGSAEVGGKRRRNSGKIGGVEVRRVVRERMCKIRWIEGIISHRMRHVGNL